MTACMGGWCAKRDQCPHHMTANRREPAERLCERGRDGVRMIDAGRRVIRIDVLTGQEIESEGICQTS